MIQPLPDLVLVFLFEYFDIFSILMEGLLILDASLLMALPTGLGILLKAHT